MKAIIMAGGLGTRLKSVTGDTPKPLALLAGRPVMEHILLLLKRCGISRVRAALNYKPEMIISRFGSGISLDMKLDYHIESEPLGTAGCVKSCADFYGERDFLVISGDCVCDFDLRQLIEAHRRSRAAVTMALYPHEQPLEYGTVLTDSHGRIVSFTEKPDWNRVVTDLVNTGIYILSPEVMKLVPENTFFDFSRDLFPLAMQSGLEMIGVPMDGYWCDVGTPRAYHRCNLDALDGKIRLEQTPEMADEKPSSPEPLPDASSRVIPCASRARAMRSLSGLMMEAGADFSDGITLDTDIGTVHISPSATQSSIVVSARARDGKSSEMLAGEFEERCKKSVKFE